MDITRDQIQEIKISNQSDIGLCRRKGVSFAKKIGFDDVKSGEIAIIITEMITNVIKHGGGKGLFTMSKISGKTNSAGIELICCDHGSGISDFNNAIKDGYSQKNSLGLGLGAIRRLSDEIEVNPAYIENTEEKQYNYCIRTRKWMQEKKYRVPNKKLEHGALSRPKPGETLNGDDYVFLNISEDVSIGAVIDGLGHGKEAHLASSLAKETIIKHAELPLDLIIKKTHDSIKGTRGVTLGIIKIDTQNNKIFFSGIGNIEGNILSKEGKKNLLSYGGILGHNIRTPRIFEFTYNKGDIVYMFSDGITARWDYRDIDWTLSPQKNTEYIFNKFSRLNDDATILIIRCIA